MSLREIRSTVLVALWFMVLTFPVMVIKVNTVDNTILWRWHNMLYVGLGTVVGAVAWRLALNRRRAHEKRAAPVPTGGTVSPAPSPGGSVHDRVRRISALIAQPNVRRIFYLIAALFVVAYPFVTSLYQTNIMITALIYVILALGLNIVIGLGGMLHLGYIAFYMVGAYTYGILNRFFGIGFWAALPIGAVLAVAAGILLALPVLRLRGDYLAIVTLGFGEIVRIVLNTTTEFSGGPQGIGGIPRPGFFGLEMNLRTATTYTYFILVAAVLLTIFVVWRFEHSRLGRALVAMGEDDIAAESMGIDLTRTKVIAFALGSLWAGLAGVIFASRTTFINPASFTVWQSVIVLCCVVLGGMGSIPGAIIGAMGLILIPEYLRAFSDFRMLMFGAILIIMMVFRPDGLIRKKRKSYTFDVAVEEGEG